MKRNRDDNIEYLFRGILSLESVEECYDFFEDLCTFKEIEEMSRRLRAARMLASDCIYTEIAGETGLSTATISRVNRSLRYGNDGYKLVLERLDDASCENDTSAVPADGDAAED